MADATEHEPRLLHLLEQLLEIDPEDSEHALDEAATAIAEALPAEKVDTFLAEGEILRARGTSETDLGRLQQDLGLDVLPIANGGRTAQVFFSGRDFRDGHVQHDPEELPGVKEMGIASTIATRFVVGTDPRGVLQASSTGEEAFDEEDLQFLRAVGRWVGTLVHRTELRDRAMRAATDEGRRLAAEELVTVLAHDLGNYLTPLRGRLEQNLRDAVRDGRDTSRQRLEASIQSVDAITQLTADLLDVSRIEEGILRLQPSEIGVRDLVREVARALGSDHVRIAVDVPENLSVKADLRRLRQVLANLVGNAVKHSPANGTVAISARRLDGEVEIRVSDEGPGVPSDIMPRVFMRYARGPRSTGLGIGLYLAERIASAHGGRLTLDSTPSGATFALRLPAPDEGSSEDPSLGYTDENGARDDRMRS
ncbi:MAG TPA: HAMP domain-containing sensor histidine kinase [Candidatus Limnocylindria bacterium]